MPRKTDLKPDTVIIRSPDLIVREMDGDIIMLSIQTGTYYGIDEIGGDIWKIIEQPISIDALCRQLMEDYDVDYETCQMHVVDFLRDLIKDDMVFIQDSGD